MGHGPSLEGAGKGHLIDSHDVVVRLKRGETLLSNPKDWGTRTDYLCASTEVTGCFRGLKPKEFWAYPKRGWYDPNTIKRIRKELPAPVWIPLNLCNMWNNWFRGLGAKHPNVSTGMGAIIICADRLRPDEIVLAGFDTLMNPKIPFSRANLPRTGVGPFPNHDWEKENLLLQILKDSYGIKVSAL